jgi:hypothetical protein
MRTQPCIQRVEHDAGLHRHRHRLSVEFDHPGQVLAVVDDKRCANGLSALRAARAARQQRHAEFAADVDRRANVVVRARNEHADRFDPMIDASVE